MNYDSFTGFAEMDETAKDLVCAEFFDLNLPGNTIGEHATGPEVAQWQADHLAVLLALNGDTKDPRNHEVAINIVDCLTSTHSTEADSKTELTSLLNTQASGEIEITKLPRIEPSGVTRYSDGTFEAHGQTYGDFAAFTVEGHYNDLGETLVHALYEWNGSSTFPAFKLVGDAPTSSDGDGLPSGGKPPVVVDSAYADFPWS